VGGGAKENGKGEGTGTFLRTSHAPGKSWTSCAPPQWCAGWSRGSEQRPGARTNRSRKTRWRKGKGVNQRTKSRGSGKRRDGAILFVFPFGSPLPFLNTVLSHLRGPPINATVIGTSAYRRALVRLRTSAVSNRACKKVLNFREQCSVHRTHILVHTQQHTTYKSNYAPSVCRRKSHPCCGWTRRVSWIYFELHQVLMADLDHLVRRPMMMRLLRYRRWYSLYLRLQ